jgi:excisionase family DNA binding protein
LVVQGVSTEHRKFVVAFRSCGAHRSGVRSNEPSGQVREIGIGTEWRLVRLLRADEVAEFLGVPVKTLYQWRYKGVGPAGVRVGRHLRYRAVDVEAWVDGRAAEGRRPPVG